MQLYKPQNGQQRRVIMTDWLMTSAAHSISQRLLSRVLLQRHYLIEEPGLFEHVLSQTERAPGGAGAH